MEGAGYKGKRGEKAVGVSGRAREHSHGLKMETDQGLDRVVRVSGRRKYRLKYTFEKRDRQDAIRIIYRGPDVNHLLLSGTTPILRPSEIRRRRANNQITTINPRWPSLLPLSSPS